LVVKPANRAYAVEVEAVQRLSPSFTRVIVTSDDFADLGCDGPDQRIKVVLPLPETGLRSFPVGHDWYEKWRLLPDADRNPIRTYAIRRADRATRRRVVDFVAHGDVGPASRWAATARVGDQLTVIAPDATSDEDAGGHEWNPGRATSLLIAGDETAVPAIAAILESLPAPARGTAFVEVPYEGDALALDKPAGIDLVWLPRAPTGASYGERLTAAVRAWAIGRARPGPKPAPTATATDDLDAEPDLLWDVPEPPEGEGLYAWLAGEAGAITGLRRFLVRDLGIDRSRVAFMGYWKLGRAEN
jgi:NADPH-dependent ferric siderophore reductase